MASPKITKKEILKRLKETSRPVIICGAGVVGKKLLAVCQKEGIKVACFCDSSEAVAGKDFCGLKVLYTPNLPKKYRQAIFLISVAAIKDVVGLLKRLGCYQWYAGGLLLKDLDISQNRTKTSKIDYPKYAIQSCIWCHEGFLDPNKLFIRSVDLIITERCSLRCKDCSNLMQYYQKPQDVPTQVLMKAIGALCQVADEVMEFRLIGGDVFMNQQWPLIIKKLLKETKVKRIVLYTNGTLIPNPKYYTLLKKNRVLTIISDYGPVSRNLKKLRKIFESNKIPYHILPVDEWLDCAAIHRHHRPVKENKAIFRVCCAKNMLTLSDGKLFRCPYAANAFRLQAVPDFPSDYLDLFAKQQTKQVVKNYLEKTSFLQTCDFCNGRPLSGPTVPPAVQISRPRPYHRFLQRD